MRKPRIIVVGASAGGVEALTRLASGLPRDLPAAVFVVLHIPPHGVSVLPQILTRQGRLPAVHPRSGETIRAGQIYVAPPDYHLLIEAGHVRLSRGPRENGHRPAADPLFRSAARHHGRSVIGVVLSGALDDGTAGLAAIKARGGIAIVQDPADAFAPGMPGNALEHVAIDYCRPASEIPGLLAELTRSPLPEVHGVQGMAEPLRQETEVAKLPPNPTEEDRHPGTPSGFACPDCGGALWEIRDGELFRFRCRVGHAWTADGLLSEQAEAFEAALWTALRALEENAALARLLASQAAERGHHRAAKVFNRRVEEATQQAKLLREIIANLQFTGSADSALLPRPDHPEKAEG